MTVLNIGDLFHHKLEIRSPKFKTIGLRLTPEGGLKEWF